LFPQKLILIWPCWLPTQP